MKTYNIIKVIFCLLILNIGCKTQKNTSLSNNAPKPYWINSLRSNCVGVETVPCYEVQQSENWEHNKWNLFYNKIEGFTYEQGYKYKILVIEKEVDPAKSTVDSSIKKYQLHKIISKELDKSLLLNNIWMLETIDQQPITSNNGIRMEINTSDTRFFGDDGCNAISGKLTNLNNESISFGHLIKTKKMCNQEKLANKYALTLEYITNYEVKNNKLIFTDNTKKNRLTYKRID